MDIKRIIITVSIFWISSVCTFNYALETIRPAWVYYTVKENVPFEAAEYFSSSKLEKQVSKGLPIFDEYDLPVNQIFIDELANLSEAVLGSSRWLNASLILATEYQLDIIEKLAFVKNIQSEEIPDAILANISNLRSRQEMSFQDLPQLRMHEADLLRENNLDGSSVKIAVFDGGFSGVDSHQAFAHLHKNNQIVSTWDFAKSLPDVYKHSHHGTQVLSCIAGMRDGIQTGMAPGAEFILARTELSGEPYKEELYWIQAAEWADQLGVDIISSSLGYAYHRYFPEDMTGDKSPVAKAANIAAKKGILVINCMGNEGDSKWKYAITPADSDSVLSVGGVDPESKLHINFSSFGPNKSGQLKPNVVAAGKVIAANGKTWNTAYGTSFSTPVITGFAACAWQLYPDYSNMEIFKLIEESGHLYPYYDYAHGYGIPKASKLLDRKPLRSLSLKKTFSVRFSKSEIMVKINPNLLEESSEPPYLYYSLRDPDNKIIRYGVYLINSEDPVKIAYDEDENIKSIYLRTSESYQIFKLRSDG